MLQNSYACHLLSNMSIKGFLTKLYYELDLSPMTLDQGHDQSHGTSLGPVKQFCEIYSVKSYGLDNVKNHYRYRDLDLWPVTLGQGCDTSFGPV